MRISRMRFSVRWLMVVVALVAGGIFSAQMIQKHRAFSELAEQNASSEKVNRDQAEGMRRRLENRLDEGSISYNLRYIEVSPGMFNIVVDSKNQAKVLDARAARNAELKQKYRY